MREIRSNGRAWMATSSNLPRFQPNYSNLERCEIDPCNFRLVTLPAQRMHRPLGLSGIPSLHASRNPGPNRGETAPNQRNCRRCRDRSVGMESLRAVCWSIRRTEGLPTQPNKGGGSGKGGIPIGISAARKKRSNLFVAAIHHRPSQKRKLLAVGGRRRF